MVGGGIGTRPLSLYESIQSSSHLFMASNMPIQALGQEPSRHLMLSAVLVSSSVLEKWFDARLVQSAGMFYLSSGQSLRHEEDAFSLLLVQLVKVCLLILKSQVQNKNDSILLYCSAPASPTTRDRTH